MKIDHGNSLIFLPGQDLDEFRWILASCISLPVVAARLYGGISRLHTRRLEKKLGGALALEEWEVHGLRKIREELAHQLSGRDLKPLGE